MNVFALIFNDKKGIKMKRNLIKTLLIAVCFLLPTMFMLSACGETLDYKITFEENGGSIVNDLTYKENGSRYHTHHST